jgi:hypothetical protein
MSTPDADTRTRTYRGGSVEELIPRIQQELGPDAIILRRREGLTGGILGFFQRSFVEIDAVTGGPRIDLYDEGQSTAAPAPPPIPPPPRPQTEYRPEPIPSYTQESPRPFTAHGAYVTEQLAALAMARSSEAPGRPREPIREPLGLHRSGSGVREHHEPGRLAPDLPPPRPPAIARELGSRALRREEPASERVLDSFAATLAAAESEPIPTRAQAERWTVPPVSRGRKRAGAGIEKRLVSFGVSESFARELIEVASAHVLPLAPADGLTRGVRGALAQRIPVAPSLPTRGAAIVVVGAGGSGKTSYCAALMRAYRKNGALEVGYGTLTRDPESPGLNLLLSPHVMWPTPVGAPRSLRALRRVRGEGLLVLDTPRLSPADRVGIRELARMLGELTPERVVVALPATLGATAATQLLEALRPLSPNALVVTHADETDQIGVAVEAACTFGIAPEYVLDRNRSGAWRVGRMDPAGLAERLLS